MLFREEAIFIENLFNAVDYLGVKMLPTDIALPERAVSKLKKYMENEMPLEYNEIKGIFAKQNLSGDYARFRDVVADMAKVRTKYSTSEVMHINKRTDCPDEKFIGLAKKFCEFAEIKV